MSALAAEPLLARGASLSTVFVKAMLLLIPHPSMGHSLGEICLRLSISRELPRETQRLMTEVKAISLLLQHHWLRVSHKL
ncbi:uncharacterized protein A4U43_C01F31880 [Asparagus officinalis]|uniref:Uncharacterized protein n=1 Tax=Asparagus officinalis TaxID=4686 RepID=A0A5P1FWK5_ASPOF|nr:uncharacterized protein A4U43_C01F31880 [Asparagus officinalis]